MYKFELPFSVGLEVGMLFARQISGGEKVPCIEKGCLISFPVDHLSGPKHEYDNVGAGFIAAEVVS
jgi:hypothetical protein